MSKYTPFSLFVRQAQLYPLSSPFLPVPAKVEKDHSYANGSLVGTLEGGGSGLPKTGQTTSFETGDDGDLEKGLPASGDRWTDNGDNTVTDNVTGLMYPDSIESLPEPFTTGLGGPNTLTWADAISAANSLSFAGYSDWRLPNILELLMLINFETNSPPWYTTYFDFPASGYYWSSTTSIRSQTKAQVLYTWFDHTMTTDIKTNVRYAIPVRNA